MNEKTKEMFNPSHKFKEKVPSIGDYVMIINTEDGDCLEIEWAVKEDGLEKEFMDDKYIWALCTKTKKYEPRFYEFERFLPRIGDKIIMIHKFKGDIISDVIWSDKWMDAIQENFDGKYVWFHQE